MSLPDAMRGWCVRLFEPAIGVRWTEHESASARWNGTPSASHRFVEDLLRDFALLFLWAFSPVL